MTTGAGADGAVDARLLTLLSTRVLDGEKIVGTRRLNGGFNNENVLLHTDRGGAFVLRRYSSRNTCAVEAAVIDAVSKLVPVPEVVFADHAGDLHGEPFMLMRFCPGVPLSAVFAGSAEQDGLSLAETMGQTLAAIGSVRFGRPGFFSDGTLSPAGDVAEHDLPSFVEASLATPALQAALPAVEQRALLDLAAERAPLLVAANRADRLVHSDFNGKNILMRPGRGSWRVAAVLDWEYAFSGSPLVDLGNMLRFPEDLPPGFEDRFPLAFEQAGGALPAQWRETSAAFDLFCLADLLTRAQGDQFTKVLAAFRRQIGR